MRSRLTPLENGLAQEEAVDQQGRQGFAVLDQDRLIALAHNMPDAQSAILLCLAWHAARQERFRLGPLAGEAVARVSGPRLVELTGRPLRTIRHALRRLKRTGSIVPADTEPGKTAVYRLYLTPPTDD